MFCLSRWGGSARPEASGQLTADVVGTTASVAQHKPPLVKPNNKQPAISSLTDRPLHDSDQAQAQPISSQDRAYAALEKIIIHISSGSGHACISFTKGIV